MSVDPALAGYFAEAASWDQDRAGRARRSARIGWTVAAVACGVIVLLGAALMMLMPLKRVVPFVIRVDRATHGPAPRPPRERDLQPGRDAVFPGALHRDLRAVQLRDRGE